MAGYGGNHLREGLNRATAGGGLAVDDLLERAVLEEYVLARGETVGSVGKDVRDLEDGRVGAGVVDTGVAVRCDAEAEVESARGGKGEAEVGRQDDILRLRCGAEFESSAVEREEQGSGIGD